MPATLIAAAIAAVAPTLAAKGADLLASVFSGAVTKGTEKVAEMVEAKTGISVQDMADGVVTNDQWEKVREFEKDHKAEILAALIELDKNDLEREKVAAADRVNARVAQQVTLASPDKFTARFQNVLTIILVLLSFVFLFWAAFLHNYTENPGAKDLINTILGFLFPVISAVVAYHYGTTLGSWRKDDRAAKLSEAIADRSKP